MLRTLKVNQTVITPRESRSLVKYLIEIKRMPLLSLEEEVDLARRIRNGDEDALDKLVKANLRFVVSVAKQYRDSYLSLNDLINEGNLGLIMAARKFDETKGFKFISYAVWWIRQSILKAIAEQSRLIRLPLNRITNLNKLNRAFSSLEQKFGREPTPDELSSETKLNTQEIDITVKTAPKHLSIDQSVREEESTSLSDLLEDRESKNPEQEMSYSNSLRTDAARLLSSLPTKYREVLELHFGFRTGQMMTLEDIGEKIGVHRERVRQIKEKALYKIRTSSHENVLKEYLCQ